MKNNQNDDFLVEERRKFIRLQISVEVKYSLLKLEPHQQLATSKNIGSGGICIMADDPLKLGNLLKLEIILPQDPPVIFAVGKVVWTKSFSILGEERNRYEVGIQFLDIGEKDQVRIKKYVFSLRQPNYGTQ